jgi:hypothetical protein
MFTQFAQVPCDVNVFADRSGCARATAGEDDCRAGQEPACDGADEVWPDMLTEPADRDRTFWSLIKSPSSDPQFTPIRLTSKSRICDFDPSEDAQQYVR